MAKTEIRVLADNTALPPWRGEHGLSLQIFYGAEQILFDTGAGDALPANLKRTGLKPDSFQKLILSHGHGDHTGALDKILPLAPETDLFHTPGVDAIRFSLHPGKAPSEISMPESCRAAFLNHRKKHAISAFTEIAPGVFLTGPIPRKSGEDTGGPFFFDAAGRFPDAISDEQSLLLDSGILITGCCHAGIVNTVNFCRSKHPEIRLRIILGGLHLRAAAPERLRRTGAFLDSLDLEKLILLHCTGAETAEFLKKNLPRCRTVAGQTGDVFHDG